MDQNTNETLTPADAKLQDRRELVRNLGQFAAYAAPFTLLAVTKKASAATAGGSGSGHSPSRQ